MTEHFDIAGSLRLSKLMRRTQEPLVRRVLVVDDEESIRTALSRFLRTRSFEVMAVGSGEEALTALLAGNRFVLMLCDIRMPGMSGVDLVPRVLEIDPNMAVVMLTAVNEATTATEVLAAGAMDYLMKPFEFSELETVLERNLHRRTLVVEQRNVERLIREDVAARTDELLLERRAVQEMSVAVVEALINAQEAKDLYLRGHSQRVAALAASIASAMGLDDELVEDIRLAGRVHDVGRIGIRESVLNKPGPLDDEEFALMAQHTIIGERIISRIQYLQPISRIVRSAHEPVCVLGRPVSSWHRISR